ncbi:hypothetical protein PF008_g652 [Phytophthora fragariae]|uniref:DUF3668 domain-containing protein n=1 Tax=Phytophthora fragariae TaxID=53985 RepID=A0A6G0SNG9_9STRA|nr:hypothetical protein PF008_g652 [Phytophthora fragariae]
MSAADPGCGDDAYASDEYELESPTRSQVSPEPPPVAQQDQTLQFDTDALEDDESDAGVVTPLPKTAKAKRARAPRESDTINGRHLMDNTPWTYTVSALQVRMLRIPVSESAAVRELRVFATIDKQAAQSRGSRWKQELQPTGGSPLRSTTRRKGASKKPLATGGRFDAYRRSGLIEEAKWVKGDGKLQWTFPMEKFRRLKAYAPRIKAFVYGIGETMTESHSQAQMEQLARQEQDSAITSFGWFFLDLRTPDLPERWLKLQNSPFGGEVLISSTFSPGMISPVNASSKSSKKKLFRSRRQQPNRAAANRTGTVPTASTGIPGENGEYLQIGDSNGQEIFVLSVFIQTALNLSKVVEAAIDEDREEFERTGFWLSYSLFDVVVQTDVFYNLSVAEFSPIRDSFRVKSSLRELALCIENLACLTVFMCTENRVLAGVEVPLLPLLSEEIFSKSDGDDNELNPGDTAGIEGTFSFPDFDEAVVTASVAVEFVESEKSKPTEVDNTNQLSDVEAITDSRSRRVGSIRVSAYLEDMGLLTDTNEASSGMGLGLPTPYALERENKTEEGPTKSSLTDAPPEGNLNRRSRSMSGVREAEEAKLHTSSIKQTLIAGVFAEKSHSTTEEEVFNRAREQQNEAAQFKETLERERSTWKQEQHLQQLQWKRRFAEMEKARMEELEEEWARREEERSNLLKSAQEEYQRLEQTLRKSLADLETRERRLTIAEAALQREQGAKRDENESLKKRLKSEQNHTLSLAKKQTEAYERRISILETQLNDAERRAKQVETDFAEYRQQQRKLPESRLREEIAALKGSVAELEKQKMVKERECEVAEANVQKMRIQLEHVASLLAQEKKKHEARVVDELEKLRVKYIAREEKYVLDGDRDELRAIKQQLDNLKGFNLHVGNRKRSSRRHQSPSPRHRPTQQWHTQSRQTAFTRQTRSASHQRFDSNGFSDRASEDGSDSSYVETNRVATAPLDVSRHELNTSSQSRRSDHEEVSMRGNASEYGDDLGASVHSNEEPTDTELGRLIRERKLLLASGAYDAQSYLVRELDRLIKVTKANSEHQSSIT